MATPWARHLLATWLHLQNSAVSHMGSTHLWTRSTFTDVSSPSGLSHPVPPWRQALPKQGRGNYILPPSSSACLLWKQSGGGKEAPTVAKARLRPLAIALIGVDQLLPLWTHPTGSDFVRGSKLAAKPTWLSNGDSPGRKFCYSRAYGRQLNVPPQQ